MEESGEVGRGYMKDQRSFTIAVCTSLLERPRALPRKKFEIGLVETQFPAVLRAS